MMSTEQATSFHNTWPCNLPTVIYSPHLFFSSSLFNMAIKIAFIIAIGTIITNTDEQIYKFDVQETNRVNIVKSITL